MELTFYFFNNLITKPRQGEIIDTEWEMRMVYGTVSRAVS